MGVDLRDKLKNPWGYGYKVTPYLQWYEMRTLLLHAVANLKKFNNLNFASMLNE